MFVLYYISNGGINWSSDNDKWCRWFEFLVGIDCLCRFGSEETPGDNEDDENKESTNGTSNGSDNAELGIVTTVPSRR
jgi:hypothetical protein